MADDELVVSPGSFTGPERRELQDAFDCWFGDLLTYTVDAVRPGRERVEPLTGADGRRWWPDDVVQHMVWIQARRVDPDAKLEDFDHLTLRDLNSARVRGYQGKGPGSGRSKRSPSGSSSADSSEA